jgi:hypothetical protein
MGIYRKRREKANHTEQ